MGVDSLYPQEGMSPLEIMDDYTSDFRMIFKEVSEEQIRKDPRTIISYMRDTKIDPAIIRVVDTMIMYSRMDFIASITSPDDSVLKYVDRIASNTYVDRSILIQLIRMMRDARGLKKQGMKITISVSPTGTSPLSNSIQKANSTILSKSINTVVNTVACKDPETGKDVMKTADGSAYYSKDLKELIRCDKNTTVLMILDSVVRISPEAFKGCMKLQELHFPRSMRKISRVYLEGCCQLETVYVPETVTALGEWALVRCPSLKNIKLPSTLKEIESFAIYDCPSISEITIPENVKIVNTSGICLCNNIRTVFVQGDYTELKPNAFDCIGIAGLYVHGGTLASNTADRSVEGNSNCTIYRD